jgi:hypothetical protein
VRVASIIVYNSSLDDVHTIQHNAKHTTLLELRDAIITMPQESKHGGILFKGDNNSHEQMRGTFQIRTQ